MPVWDTINWEPLLRRPAVTISPGSVYSALAEKRILITGAGGSIGAALARAISPAGHLLLVDHSEQALYELDREFASRSGDVRLLLGDAGDPDLLRTIFRDHRPQVVFHAAAFKHVPLLEQNPFAATANNVIATSALLDAAGRSPGCEQFLLVSTDKAVDPCSMMGAAKRIAELLMLAPAGGAPARKTVRLGNVLGSHGSVVPFFLDRLAHGLPLTVTHPDVRRFLMTTEESIAALLAAVSEQRTGILVPGLGTPVRIVDLARYLHALSKPFCRSDLEPDIVFTGLRPGDKLEETLLSGRESWSTHPHVNHAELGAVILRHVTSPAANDLGTTIASLRDAVQRRDLPHLLGVFRALVPEYTPSSVLAAKLRTASGTDRDAGRAENTYL